MRNYKLFHIKFSIGKIWCMWCHLLNSKICWHSHIHMNTYLVFTLMFIQSKIQNHNNLFLLVQFKHLSDRHIFLPKYKLYSHVYKTLVCSLAYSTSFQTDLSHCWCHCVKHVQKYTKGCIFIDITVSLIRTI